MKHQTESGEVAMLMVGIFTAVFSVLAVGLSYVMVNTVRNSKNDTLSYNARAAAESGIEDAKRFLKYCYKNDFGHLDKSNQPAWSICDVMYTTHKKQNCNEVLQKMKELNKLQDKAKNPQSLDINFEEQNGNLLVPVGKRYAGHGSAEFAKNMDPNKENLQYYQCLYINTLTRSYEGVLNDISFGGRSVVIPLKLVDDNRRPARAKTIVISWHNIGDKPEGDGKADETPNEVTLPTQHLWSAVEPPDNGIRPAVLRAQFIPVSRKRITLDDMTNDSRAVTLRPTSSSKDIKLSTGGAIRVIAPTIEKDEGKLPYDPAKSLSIEDYKPSLEPNTAKNIPLAGVTCPQSSSSSAYACSAAFNYSSASSTFDTNSEPKGHDWFLRINSVYSNTHFRVTAYDENDNPLWFDGVQPSVDVTGKSAESYARVHARLEPVNDDKSGLGNWWPEFAISTRGDICKNLTVRYIDGKTECRESWTDPKPTKK